MKRNLFIVFEGIDGSGKSTQVKLLTQRLLSNGHKVYSTFEPTDNPIGSLIRNILKGRMNADHKTIAGLFVADRLDHLLNEVNGIVKKLEEGCTVISDRYYFSSYAYHGSHMKMDWVIQANEMSADILKPDINIFIDVSPEIAMKRISENRSSKDLYESLENLNSVREKYFEAFDKLKARETISVINGNRSIDAVSHNIWIEIEKLFKLERLYT